MVYYVVGHACRCAFVCFGGEATTRGSGGLDYHSVPGVQIRWLGRCDGESAGKVSDCLSM